MSSETLSHDDAIGQFCGVTGADEERAKGLLEACDWNLELAINMHVDTDDGRGNKPSTSNSSADAASAGPSTSRGAPLITIPDHSIDDEDDSVREVDVERDSRPSRPTEREPARSGAAASRSNHTSPFCDIDNVRPPIPPVRQVLVQQPAGFSSEAPHNYRTAGRRTARYAGTTDVYDAFRDFQAEAQWQEMVEEGESGSDSSTQEANKRRTLQELFRPPLDVMFRGSFDSAREVGQLQNKWLLVNIQNGREFACQTLNRDVWSNQTVKDILKEHFIFWQVYHDSFEGSRYRQFYNVTLFPNVSIIDPRTGEEMKSWPTSIDHNSFCDSVIEFLTEHPSPDGSGDANTMKKLRVKEEDAAASITTLYDQSEEAQLEAAIRASLQDSENSNSSEPLDSSADGQQDESSSVPPTTETQVGEPASDLVLDESQPATTVQVRLVDSSRLIIRLNLTHRIRDLMSHIRDIRPQYSSTNFVLATAFPARELTDLEQTVSEAQLANAALLQKIKHQA